MEVSLIAPDNEMKNILFILFFIGILIEGSIDNKSFYELEIYPDFSGKLLLEDCPKKFDHLIEGVKIKYYPAVPYYKFSCKEYLFLKRNLITNQFNSLK